MQTRTIGGIHLHYFALCIRKLWLYEHGITMENESDRVLEGKILHEKAYPQVQNKEVLIDNAFKLDMFDGDYVREVKNSSKMEKADEMQMLYYLYQLELRGITKKGLISYTKERKTKEIQLGEKERNRIKKAIAEALKVTEQDKPPAVKRFPYCKSCAYYGFCYSAEDDEEC